MKIEDKVIMFDFNEYMLNRLKFNQHEEYESISAFIKDSADRFYTLYEAPLGGGKAHKEIKGIND